MDVLKDVLMEGHTDVCTDVRREVRIVLSCGETADADLIVIDYREIPIKNPE